MFSYTILYKINYAPFALWWYFHPGHLTLFPSTLLQQVAYESSTTAGGNLEIGLSQRHVINNQNDNAFLLADAVSPLVLRANYCETGWASVPSSIGGNYPGLLTA